jgi:spore cortex formation protein SpoVR/YcgB (stage V sporulation)
LANSYERHQFVPQIEVVKVDPDTRQLTLQYKPYLKRPLANAEKMLKHVHNLWGHGVVLYDDKNNKLAAT